jgi:hypothetical protein
MLQETTDWLRSTFLPGKQKWVGRNAAKKTMRVSASPTIPTIQIRGSKMGRMKGKQGRPPSAPMKASQLVRPGMDQAANQ